jgi:hypothetical protein
MHHHLAPAWRQKPASIQFRLGSSNLESALASSSPNTLNLAVVSSTRSRACCERSNDCRANLAAAETQQAYLPHRKHQATSDDTAHKGHVLHTAAALEALRAHLVPLSCTTGVLPHHHHTVTATSQATSGELTALCRPICSLSVFCCKIDSLFPHSDAVRPHHIAPLAR